MKLMKILICITLSFAFLFTGIGFAQLSDEITFTGSVNFHHTGLYLSNVTPGPGVNVTGYSGTLLNLTATAGSTLTLSITNPLSDPYYYLNATAGDHELTIPESELALGAEVPPSGTITFTVTLPEIDHSHAIKFYFTLIPPAIEGGDENDDEDNDGFIDSTNATIVVDFAINHLEYGLNTNGKHTFSQWCNEDRRVLFCLENTISGGNLSKIFSSLGAANVYFTMEWVSETQYNLYLYFSNQATSANVDKYIVVYKQEVAYNSVEGLWITADSYKGLAKAVREGKHVQIEIAEDQNGDDYIVWYDNESDLPDDAVLAQQPATN